VANPQQVQKLSPELIEVQDTIDKNILVLDKILALVRKEKINVWIADDPTKYDTLIWSRGMWGQKYWAGDASIELANEIKFTAQEYAPDKIFYEIFVTDTELSYYPEQYLYGLLQLDYNDYVESNTIYRANDYSVVYSVSSETVDSVTYNYASPAVTDSLLPTTLVKITVKGYVVEWHGQDWSKSTDFTTSDDLLRWSVGKWSNKVYSGGSISFPGTFTNTTIEHGYLKATAPTGVFESDVLLTATKNIEKVKLVKVENLLGGTVTYEVSADNGVSYKTITTFGEFVTVANPGTQLRLKITITGSAMVDSIYIETDEFTIQSSISSTNTRIQLGSDTDGWTTVNNEVFTTLAVDELRYKLTCIYPDSQLYIKSVRVEYQV